MTPSRFSSRLGAALLSLALVAAPGSVPLAQSPLPALGESASADLDVHEERRIGLEIMGLVRRDPAYLDDPELLDHVRGLWRPLVAAARAQGHIGSDTDGQFAYEVFLVRDRSVNAFALPGGHVGVHLGLVAMTGSPDELASVLAHELSHVTQRHIARRIGDQQRVGLAGAAAMIVAILAAARSGNADVAQAAVVGGQAAMVQGQLNFSRDMEREADRIGFALMEGAGMSTRGMASMFERLDQANRLNDSGAFPYLRSHPLTTDRIGEARERVRGDALPVRQDEAHALMQWRARVLMDPSVAGLQALQAPLPQAGLPAAYARGLIAIGLRDEAGARDALRTLTAQRSPSLDETTLRMVQRQVVELHLFLGDAAAARDALTTAGAREGRAGLLLATRVALAAADARLPQGDATLRQAMESMQVWTTEQPDDVGAWQALGQLADRAGFPLRALRAQAEAQRLQGDLPGAVDRLRGAQRGAVRAGIGADSADLLVVDARLRAWEQQLRDRMLEQRRR